MSNEILLNGASCPVKLPTGPNGYYLGISNGVPTWLPFSTDIALLLRSRSLSISQSGAAAHTADIELGSIDGHSDVDTTTVAPINGQVLTYDGTNWVPKSASGHPAATITQANLPFSANTATQTFRIPAVPVLTPNNTTGILTFNPGDGTVTTINICALIASCIHNFRTAQGSGVPASTANDPLVWTDQLTGFIYLRDIAGVVTRIDTPNPSITEGPGFPPSITNSPTIYTDTDTSDTYYRDSTGAFVKLAINTPILVTSGVGVPAATTSAPTIYTDTTTNTVYFRDTNGLLTIIYQRSLPVAIFETTDITGFVYTYDGSFSTSTESGVTITGYAWSVVPVGTSGAAVIATPTASTTTITFPSVGSWLVGLTVTDSNGKTDTVTKLIEVSDAALVAAYEITSKVGLTAAFDAASSVNAATYAWTAVAINGTVGAPVFGTPAAVTTTVAFPNDGEWQITLTVTDSAGNTKAVTKNIAVARYITVNGAMTEINGQRFDTLQAAINWINANDAANASLYTILVQSVTSDAARIVPNTARVHFDVRGKIPVGVDFPAGVYRWTGSINMGTVENGIAAATGHGITTVAGTILQFDGIQISAAAAASHAISAGGNPTIVLNHCYLFSSNGSAIVQTAGQLTTSESQFDGRGVNLPAVSLSTMNVNMRNARVSHANSTTLALTGCAGIVKDVYCNTAASAVAGNVSVGVDINASVANTLSIDDVQVDISGNGVAPGYAASMRIQGALGTLRINGGWHNATQFGVVRFNTAGNNVVLANISIRATTAFQSTSTLATITAAAWNPARVHGCLFEGLVSGPVTFAAGVAFGTNTQM